jgi:hypothetical protein
VVTIGGDFIRAKFNSPQELKEKIDKYFTDMDVDDRPYTIAQLAVYLGCDRDVIYRYEHKNDEYHDIIKEARNKIIAYLEERTINGNNPAGKIFILKQYGYSDRVQTENVNVNISKTSDLKDEDLDKKIKELGEQLNDNS